MLAARRVKPLRVIPQWAALGLHGQVPCLVLSSPAQPVVHGGM